jgi:hypothetical protein
LNDTQVAVNKKYISYLRQRLEMTNDWIDVKDKLPEVHKGVLAWSTLDDCYVLACLRPNNNWFCQPLYGVSYYTNDGVSHWQELPKRIGE